MTQTSLKERFLKYLQDNCVGVFTTKEALTWYKENKANPLRVDYSNLYTVILHPLILDDSIKRTLTKGIWEVCSTSRNLDALQIGDLEDQADPTEREFLEYLKSKGVT
jgi:hypothetical protein